MKAQSLTASCRSQKSQSKAVCAKALHSVFLKQAASAGTLQSQSEEAAKNAIDGAYRQLKKSFDEVNGGFSTAPKFPKPSEIALMFVTQHMLRMQDTTEANEGEKVRTSVRFICGSLGQTLKNISDSGMQSRAASLKH